MRYFFISYLIISILLIPIFSSCDDCITNESIDQIPQCSKAWKRQFQGHQYIYFFGIKGDCVIHDPDCPCKKNKIEQRKELMDYLEGFHTILFGIECDVINIKDKVK